MEKKTPRSVDEYIAGFDKGTGAILEKIPLLIRQLAPTARETMSYGIPTYKLEKNLVHFAGYKHHIGFYPTPSVIEHFKEELTAYKSAKGSVQFPLKDPIPYELIGKMVKYRLAQLAGST